jgi:hypothetical protein
LRQIEYNTDTSDEEIKYPRTVEFKGLDIDKKVEYLISRWYTIYN